jgi:hypothetical protein
MLWKLENSACRSSINSLARPGWHHTFSDVVLCKACTNTCERGAKAWRLTVNPCCLLSSAHPELYTMFGATVVLALATLGAVSPAAATEQQNQLETARLAQPVQRLEFGVEGDNSAFKFRFADPVPLYLFPFLLLPEPCGRRTSSSRASTWINVTSAHILNLLTVTC